LCNGQNLESCSAMTSLLASQIATILVDLAPYALTDERSDGAWAMSFGPWPEPDWQASGDGQLRQFGLTLEGQAHFSQLVELLRAQREARQWWGSSSLEGMAQAAVGALAFDYRTPADAAEVLAGLLTTAPPERHAIAAVRGLRIDSATDLCGLRLRPYDLEALCRELGLETRRGPELATRLPGARPGLSLAVIACQADEDVAAVRLRERVSIALPLLLLSRPEHDVEWFFDGSVTLGANDVVLIPSIESGRVSEGSLPTQSAADLAVDGPALADALARRVGLRRIADLAAHLPSLPSGKMSRRLLRAARLLGESFEGSSPDRFVRRWMALEALLGDGRPELSDRLCERIAVLTADGGSARLERKTALRELYNLRSRHVHGADDFELEEHTATWFRMIAMHALERAAEVLVEKEDELFERIEKAKFEGTPVDSGPLP